MPLKYGNRIKVNAAAAPAFGNFILGTAVAGYQSVASGISGVTTGDTVRYVIEDGSNWEIGTGTYNTTGPQIARTVVIQSSAGGSTLINATANAVIMVTVAAGDFLPSDGGTVTGTVVLPATTSIGNVSSTEIGYVDGVTSAIQTQLDAKAARSNATFSGSITEGSYTFSGSTVNIWPTDGTVQIWTVTANATVTFTGFNNYQSLTLMISNASGYSVNWPSMQWKTNGGVAPTLNTSSNTAIVLWKVSNIVYGARIGNN